MATGAPETAVMTVGGEAIRLWRRSLMSLGGGAEMRTGAPEMAVTAIRTADT
jgi:hypothetical protein